MEQIRARTGNQRRWEATDARRRAIWIGRADIQIGEQIAVFTEDSGRRPSDDFSLAGLREESAENGNADALTDAKPTLYPLEVVGSKGARRKPSYRSAVPLDA